MPHATDSSGDPAVADEGSRRPEEGAEVHEHDRKWHSSRVHVWRQFNEVPSDLGPTVVSIGNFDGVHRGHQHVLRQARTAADELGLEKVVVVTFDPHPIAVLRPEHAPPTLTSIDTRVALLAEQGVDAVLVVPFDREIAAWSPDEFVERVLVSSLAAKAVVVGANFRYGSRAAGDVATLRESGVEHGFGVDGVPLDGGPQVWSSTYVRQCLATGDVAGAAEALGRAFTVRGEVVRGDQRGRELGYPTANVPTPHAEAAPADGVYAGWLTRRDTGERYPAAISVGTNPTFSGERARRVESYVLDRDDLELYGVEVEVAFVDRLRGMVRFDSVETLVEQMHDDVERARQLLA
ncbi:bifunctional riboflavin kinase/FAD synthetase [Nocardioides jishulii]|uniref:Riboflavin biosynthesis protein n=1 Tax=Nocardioides jishulii TaxID=2575440 RepID=A0A4U2YKY5_9ACTN|nr:bifunctional riboflavin kinase/FAD synthetase [Nocardioides jishulii]